VRLGVRVNDPTILKDVIARLPPGSKPAAYAVVDHLYSIIGSSAKPDSRVRRLSLGYWNLIRFGRAREFSGVLDAFESHVQLTVAEYAPRCVFVHAGVVGWKDRAIVIPGLSHSGKTTLVDQLIRAGATYYSMNMPFWMAADSCILTREPWAYGCRTQTNQRKCGRKKSAPRWI